MGNRVHAPPTARGPVLGKIYKQAYSRIMDSEQPPKPVRWTGSSQKDLRSFPQPVRVATLCRSERRNRSCGQAAQKGFGGRSVLEIVADHRGDTWRSVYTVRFQDAVYVLHAFQKKSTSGIATPKKELELIWRRLARSEERRV